MISIILVLSLILYIGVLPNALNILAIAGIITAIGYKYKNLFNKAYVFYIIALVISGISLFFYRESYFLFINRGFIGYGFLFVVMMMGVLPNKWTLTRNLKKNRGVFSILAFILITPHAVSHVFGLLGGINIFGIIAYVIMVPLTVISFRVIRKEIDVADWFKIQKAAYLIYLVLFAHLIMVARWENKIVYAVLLTLYVNNKLIKEYRK